jgi:galactokinase/mevalonate kinase-like predicted kinase
MIRSTAPGRAGIVGNPTDGYGGTVVSSSLAERAMVSLTAAAETRLDVCGQRETIRSREDLRLTGGYTDIAKAVLTMFEGSILDRSFHLEAATSIPMRAGLAGSTAMITAILGAVLRLLEIDLNRYQIAEATRKIEFETMGVTCGFQDQYMAAFGGLNCLDFRGKDPHAAGQEPIFAMVEPLAAHIPELPALLANTGVQHHSGTVHKGLRERWIEGEPAVVQGYVRIADLAREAKKALLNQDWECLGAAMNENHAIQRDLGGSGEANERLIGAALGAGAWGAKLAGAGHGGTILALHPEPDRLAIELEEAGAVRVLPVTPSDGLIVESEY